jgi:hypothetical protein
MDFEKLLKVGIASKLSLQSMKESTGEQKSKM